MTKSKSRVAVRNFKRLQKQFNETERPDFKLRRDLTDARNYLVAVKVLDKVRRKVKNLPNVIRAQLVEAEEEADQVLGVEYTVRKA